MTLEARLRDAAEEVQHEAAMRPIPTREVPRGTRARARIALAAALVVVTVGGTAVVAQQRTDRTRVTTGLAVEGRTTIVLFPTPGNSGDLRADRAVIARRLRFLNLSPVTMSGDARSLRITGPSGLRSVAATLTRTGAIEFRPVLGVRRTLTTWPASPRDQNTAPAPACAPPSPPVRADQDITAVELGPDERPARCYQLGPSALTNPVVLSATVGVANNSAAADVTIHFDPTASARFDELAKANFQRQIAILLDGVVLTAPTVNATQFGGTVVMTGPGSRGFTDAEASDLAAVLTSGMLPVPLSDHRIVDS